MGVELLVAIVLVGILAAFPVVAMLMRCHRTMTVPFQRRTES